MTLVDSNVLLDIFGRTPAWWEWSLAQLEAAARRGPLLINDVVSVETSIRFPVMEYLEAALEKADIAVAPMPRIALFLAGKASVQYRHAGGVRSGVLPDFLIGAHAVVAQLSLLTRDKRRYRTYFPTLELIAPEDDR